MAAVQDAVRWLLREEAIDPEALLKPEKLEAAGQEEFWGLWNQHLSKTGPVRVENAQKSIVFAALWCRALALKLQSSRGAERGLL